MRRIFITGIGTEIGKTIVSSIFTEALKADYWKPVQTGSEQTRDTEIVKSLLSNSTSVLHPESVMLTAPLSPHAAAELEQQRIAIEKIKVPESTNSNMIIEGAGGLLVPLNENETMLDLILSLDAEVVLVSKNYLGSINHTLLSCEQLKRKGCKVLGMVVNNSGNEATERVIAGFAKLPILLKIKEEKGGLTRELVKHYASQISML